MSRGRPRTGSLVPRTTGWHGRVFVKGPDGKEVRTLVDLGTTSKSVARRKLNALVRNINAGRVDQETAEVAATRGLSVDAFADEYYQRRESLGVKTWRDEKRWFERYIKPHIGGRALEEVESTEITDLLLAAVKAGRPRESVKKIRVECARLFRTARKSKLIVASPVDDADIPKMKERKRTRTLLTDAEFVQYVLHPHERRWSAKSGKVDFEIKVRAIVARTIGGARTSDENALDWSVIDLVNFERLVMYRPKTDAEDVYEVPDVARPFLRAWWESHGSPSQGPVFPIRRGPRAGKQRGKDSFAHRYRRDLLVAGVTRHELHNDTERTRRTDFHSFRRSFSTALKRAKVDAREAMRLTAHTSFETHQRYVQDGDPIAAPPAAALPPISMPLELPANTDAGEFISGRIPCQNSGVKNHNSGSGWQDLNLQQPAPKESGEALKQRQTSSIRVSDPLACASRHTVNHEYWHECVPEIPPLPADKCQKEPAVSSWLIDAQLADALLAVALRGMAARSALRLGVPQA